MAAPSCIPPEVIEECKNLLLTDSQLTEVSKRFLDNIKRGLAKDTHEASIVKCFITYVQDLPTGKEKGKYLALDLGGTNFRVLMITLNEGAFDMLSKIYAVPTEIMTSTSVELFDHIAACLADFTQEHNIQTQALPLGFTFSFPLAQKGLKVGLLERWTKGFHIPDAIGKDVCQLLHEAICRRQDTKIDVLAVLNDTTGTLMSCAWKNPECKIGLIIGTGTNSCYVEKVENAEMFHGRKKKPFVIINTESGAFGDDGCLDFVLTEFDKDIDKNTINPGKQTHEKMISGMYMGELVRLLLVKLIKKNLLFGGTLSDQIQIANSFETKFVTDIESDQVGSYENVRAILADLGYTDVSDVDCEVVRYACTCFSERAGRMVGASIATLINKMGFNPVTVGIDGTLYRLHPRFHNIMTDQVKKMVKPDMKFHLMLSEDGSGRGAALVAAVAASSKIRRSCSC